jgi:hypothetical protein
VWAEKPSDLSFPFFDDELGADVTDLDNYTYFNTIAELKIVEIPSDW